MKIEEPLRPFTRRLRLEAWVNAAFLAVAAGAATALLVMLICRVFAFNYPFGLLIGLSVGIAAATAVVTYYVMYRAGVRQVLRRVDEAGLEDRVSMMYEQWGDNSYLAVRQREDTLRRLRAVKPRAIRLRLPLFSAILVLAVALTSIGVAALPPHSKRVQDVPIEDSYIVQNDEVKKLIDYIDKKVTEAFPDGDVIGDRLNEIIKDIKDALFDKDGNIREDLKDEEKASELDGAIERIDNLIRETLVSATIGRLLQKMPRTEVLGDALLTRKESDVNAAVDAMFAAIPSADDPGARAEYLSGLSTDLLGAVAASGAWEQNELVAALNGFAAGLTEDGAQLASVFDTAKGEINRALDVEKEREAALEEIKKGMEDAIGDLMDDYKNSDKHINPDLNKPDSDKDKNNSGGNSSNLPSTDEEGPGKPGSAIGGGSDDEAEFTYYDPILKAQVKLTAENVEAYKERLDRAAESGQYTEEQKKDFYNYYNELLESLKKS